MQKLIYNFNINLIVRLIIFGFLVSLFTYVILERNWYFTPIFIAILILLNLWNILFFLTSSHRDLKDFVESVKQRDFLHGYNVKNKSSFKQELADAYEIILKQLQQLNIEKETHYHFLQTINEQTGAALICMSKEGSIELINPSAKKLIGKPNLRSINDLKEIHPDLYKVISTSSIIRNNIVNVESNQVLHKISVSVKEFSLKGEYLKLIHMQNINSELEVNETESWQKLIRVLTHEILNSLTPVVSLTGATAELLQSSNKTLKPLQQLEEDDIQDVYTSIRTVQDRSKSLINFVNAFKSISKLPKPRISDVDISKVLSHIQNLLETEISNKGILLSININENANYLRADIEMLEQVIINLIFNAIDAVQKAEKPKIKIEVSIESNNSIIIQVSDNGCGIGQKDLEQIFIPFFTTKQHGSGIGLSLVRQIMHLHNGVIQVKSKIGEGSKMSLIFPK